MPFNIKGIDLWFLLCCPPGLPLCLPLSKPPFFPFFLTRSWFARRETKVGPQVEFYFSSGDVLSACHGFILSWVTAVHQLNPKSQKISARAEDIVLYWKSAVGSGFGISFGREIQVQNMWEVHPFHTYSYLSKICHENAAIDTGDNWKLCMPRVPSKDNG